MTMIGVKFYKIRVNPAIEYAPNNFLLTQELGKKNPFI